MSYSALWLISTHKGDEGCKEIVTHIRKSYIWMIHELYIYMKESRTLNEFIRDCDSYPLTKDANYEVATIIGSLKL